MQALILAAGMGTRLGSYTKEIPKCMVVINSKTLIERQIEYLIKNDIKKIVIACGYQKDKLKEYLTNKRYPNVDFVFVENNKYETTNNIYTLFLAREYLKQDDTILLESDLIFEENIIKKIIKADGNDVIAVSKYERGMDGTCITVNLSKQLNKIYTKQYFDETKSDEYYKTINIYKLSKEFCNEKYIPNLEKYIEKGKFSNYYEEVFKEIEDTSEIDIGIFEKEKWYEIDTAQDLEKAKLLFKDC